LLGGYASVTHQLGGEFVRLDDRNVARALVGYVRKAQATEVVLGHRRRARWLPSDTTSEIIRLSGVDVHILRARQRASPRGSALGLAVLSGRQPDHSRITHSRHQTVL
jgi:K+-sensing histidine kinase KdpD